MKICRVELIGCGAQTEIVHAPVLAHLEKSGRLQVTGLVDPAPDRRLKIANLFPAARQAGDVRELLSVPADLAVIVSPPAAHAGQACALLAAGRHVLCEKPLATSLAECETMVATAHSAQRLLAAAMMRRFYPAAQALRENLLAGLPGDILTIEVIEGGRFGWNIASPKFYRAENGGVLYDLGSHVLDLLCHWLGEPVSTTTQLDSFGGTNTNALLTARWAKGHTARIRLSWDIDNLPIGWRIAGDRGEYGWNGSSHGPIMFQVRGGRWWRQSNLQLTPAPGRSANFGHLACYCCQIENVLAAIEDRGALLAPAADVLPSLRWLENARRLAQPLPQNWLSPLEQAEALRFFNP